MLCCFPKKDQKPLSLQVWPIQDPEEDIFPEQANGMVQIDMNSVGVAMSGGGSRSHSLCAGYLRALHDLKLHDQISYISAVSGGSWATSIYTFADEDDTELLGENTPPSMCHLGHLRTGHPGKLAKVVSQDFHVMETIAKFLIRKVKAGDFWQRMIGESILADFGLDGKIIAANHEHKQEILERNFGNTDITKRSADIIVPKANRPFLIVNAAVGGPDGYSTGWGNSLQFTPLYSGVPFYKRNRKMPFVKHMPFHKLKVLKNKLTGTKNNRRLSVLHERQMVEGDVGDALELTIGGGVVESFAFGTKTLDKEEDYFGSENATGKIKKGKYFRLEDAIGASSAAFAATFGNLDLGVNFTPDANYFPVLSRTNPELSELEAPQELLIGDGGVYENTGLLPLLQRGLRKMVCFINSYVPLDKDFLVDRFTNEAQVWKSKGEPYHCADTQLLSFFGCIKMMDLSCNYTNNEVFETDALNDVMLGFLSSIKQGKGAVTKQTLKLLRNDDWNIIGGYDVEVLFVYNETCTNFVKELPRETQKVLKQPDGPFGEFPFYKTVFQNDAKPFSLELQEVNLLAAQAEFVVRENKDLFNEIFGNLEK